MKEKRRNAKIKKMTYCLYVMEENRERDRESG